MKQQLLNFKQRALVILNEIDKYDDHQISDAYETLGKVQLYSGEYLQGIFNLEEAIKPQFNGKKSQRSTSIIQILVFNYD
jgi:hypothetical protein